MLSSSQRITLTARGLIARCSVRTRMMAVAHSASSAGDTAPSAAAGRPKIIVITGPTAVGKTKVGLELARRLGGEIISADSVQVYTGLDVGSDKLPEPQRMGVPHHLIDVLPPTAEFSAGDFHDLGRAAADDIIARGRVPIVVGGTGFYLRWFMRGKAQTQASSPELAARATALIQEAWAKAAAEAAPVAGDAAEDEQNPLLDHQQQQQDDGSGGEGQGADDAGEQRLQHRTRTTAERREWRRALAARRAAAREAAPPTERELRDSNMPPGAPPGMSRGALWDAAVTVIEALGDPEAAARVRAERHNWYRLMRVAQILLASGGAPLSALDVGASAAGAGDGTGGSSGDTAAAAAAAAAPAYDFRCFFLYRPRAELYDRIALRVEEMVAGGLLREAAALLDLGAAPGGCQAARAIGYRQAMECVARLRARAAEAAAAAAADAGASGAPAKAAVVTRADLVDLAMAVGSATRGLVKQQHTWFRDDGDFKWVDASASTDDVVDAILREVDKPRHEGGCGDSGQLDAASARALREYRQAVKLLVEGGDATARALADAAAAVVCGGGGGGGGGGGVSAQKT